MLKRLAALVIISGCASAPVSTDKTVAAEAPIRAAEEMGANGVPQAALQLKLAQEQSDQAKQAMTKGDKERAEMLLLRAQVDAELALALAKEGPLATQALAASDEVKALQKANEAAK